MRRRVLPLVLLFLSGCGAVDWTGGLRTANTIANGVACGMAAANGTPCTPQAVLDALARDADAQRAKVAAVAPQAAAIDPVQTQALLDELAANTRSNEALTKALLELATRAPAPPSAALPMAPAVLPPPVSSTAAPPAPAP